MSPASKRKEPRSDEPEVWRVFQRRGTIALLNLLRKEGATRSSDVERGLVGIAKPVIYSRIKELQNLDLISRTVSEGPPIETRYSLTSQGEKLSEAAAILESFGTPNAA